ncbi:hypothetical protein HDU98_000098 [Podochytrium sp. JEL0797]|nr:hypothetical protein HDU98_000098 [Podochytrium sp. JEL0797]
MQLLVALLLAASCFAVKRGDFKTCSQSSFCARQRAFAELKELDAPKLNQYSLLSSTLHSDPTHGILTADLMDTTTNAMFVFSLNFLDGNSLRAHIKEKAPLTPEFDIGNIPSLALVTNGTNVPFTVISDKDPQLLTLRMHSDLLLSLHASPFRFEVVEEKTKSVVMRFNERGFFHYEHQRRKDDPVPVVDEPQQEVDAEGNLIPLPELTEHEKTLKRLREEVKKDMWEESFGGKQDSKPHGPTSKGFDISFPSFQHVYGLPQHASSFALKSTRGPNAPYSDPYRLYNFDVFEYELDNNMALYGSVPFLMAHKKGRSVGVLAVNAAEMWVDVEKKAGDAKANLNLQDEYTPFSPPHAPQPSTTTHWMIESGTLDLLFFFGPTPRDIHTQLTHFTGRSALPQQFAIGYHQSRWNYLDEQDVLDVDDNFDRIDFPVDVIWLDIEHTDGKRYFTWDGVKFPDPKGMQEALGMVTIVDPHLKADTNYPVAANAKSLGLLVQNKDRADFDGWCWPGTSYWIDYLNPSGRQFWAEQFGYDKYKGSTPFLYTWNDMNEPSVFSGPEITMPKDNLHFGGVEHRDVHNVYGALQHRATGEGHVLRSGGLDRPFVLSRAFFIGTQRYGAIWTGDNTAEWGHLEASVPMLLTIGVSGVVFCGADVGGFFGNPDTELLVRWYQAAAYQPFFRAHAHIDTKRREPWLYGEVERELMREAVRSRYRMMPYLYTVFWEASLNGAPVMRSLMSEFPDDEETFEIENAFMVGSAVLVHPVVKPGVSSVDVYLPPAAKWYDMDTYLPMSRTSNGLTKVLTPLEKVPTYLRAGSILTQRNRIRRAVTLSLRDPYTLVIALNDNGTARGKLYVDDGHSFAFEQGVYIETEFVFEAGVLRASVLHKGDGVVGARVERVVVLGVGKGVKSVTVEGGRRVQFLVEAGGVVVVKDPKVVVGEEWGIVFA